MIVLAGSCLLGEEKKAIELAEFLKENGADVFRAKPYRQEGTWKPTKEYPDVPFSTFHKIQEIMPIATEVYEDFDHFNWFDFIWTPARQMQNYQMLKELNCVHMRQNVILKRHFGCTVEEVFGAVTYLNNIRDFENLWICERGIVSFDRRRHMRWRPDLLIIPELKRAGLKVLFDPSHSTGNYNYVIPMAKAAVAAGADGIMVEVCKNPKESYSDRRQIIDYGLFKELVKEIKCKPQ